MDWKTEGKHLTRSALGRNVFNGALYDLRTENLSFNSLFKSSLPSNCKQSEVISKTECQHKLIENVSDRFDLLNVEKELQIPVLCKLIEIDGIGKFLTEEIKSEKIVFYSLLCKFLTVRESFSQQINEILDHIDLNVLKDTDNTHVIVEVNWGANCLLTLEKVYDSDLEKMEIKSSLEAKMSEKENWINSTENKNLKMVEDQLEGNPLEKCNDVCIKMLSDIMSEEGELTHVTLEKFHSFLMEIPDLLKKVNDGKGNPLNFTVIPLSFIRGLVELKNIPEVVIKPIDEGFLMSALCLFEDIAALKQKLHDFHKELNEFKNHVNEEDVIKSKEKIDNLQAKEEELKSVIAEEWKMMKWGEKNVREVLRRMENFKSQKLCLYLYEDFLESQSSIRSHLATIGEYISSGAYYLRRNENFVDLFSGNLTSEFIVLVFSSGMKEKDSELYENTCIYFKILLTEPRRNTKYVVFDLDLFCDSEDSDTKHFLNIPVTMPKIFDLKGNTVINSDLYGDYLIEIKSNFVRLAQGMEFKIFEKKPGNSVPLEMTCPGYQSGLCNQDKLNWLCFFCKNDIEYGFDNYFYCSCGKGSTNGFEYRCSNLQHKNVFLSPSSEFLAKQLANLKPLEELNVLILGQSGVGKSTWINSIINYLNYKSLENAKIGGVLCQIPISITIYDPKTLKKHVVNIGDVDSNEVTATGKSATQCCQAYNFVWENRLVRLIDSPGLGDTRGIDQDKKNMNNIVDYLSYFKELHAVCILLKANDNRINAIFSYCIKELLVHLHRSVAKNIVFCFTNARNSFYTPGQTSSLLEKLLDNIDIRGELTLSNNNMFCLDNEAFVFLCSLNNPEISYEKHLVDSFEKSWEISLKETERMFNTIKNFKPHQLRETLSLVTSRARILSLTKPIAEISKTIQMNLALIEKKKKEITTSNQTIGELAKKLVVTEIHLESEDINYPRTVCTSPKCVEYLDYVDVDVKQIEYKTHCHSHCYLKSVEPKTVNNPALQKCNVMVNGKCKVCGCDWRNHMHITFSQRRIERRAVNKNVETNIQKELSDIEKIQQFVRRLEETTSKYKKEQEIIIQTSVKFGMFLKQNAISVYNDFLADYLNYLIEEEENKPHKTEVEKKLLKTMKETLSHYEAEVQVLQEVVKKSKEEKSQLTSQEVFDLEQQLYALELTGKDIKMSVDLNRISSEKTFLYTEIPLKICPNKLKRYSNQNNCSLSTIPKKPIKQFFYNFFWK